jgi:hypothetical protein
MLYLALVIGFVGGCRFEVMGVLGVEDAPDGGVLPARDLSLADLSLADLSQEPPTGDLALPPDLLPIVPMLAGSVQDRPGHVNLSMVGTVDWAHWGLSAAGDFNHKSGICFSART